MFTGMAKNSERKLSERPNDLTPSLPAEFLGDSRLCKSLSKPDVRDIAKAYPRIPVRGHKSSGISQTAEVAVGCPAGEEPFTPCNGRAFGR